MRRVGARALKFDRFHELLRAEVHDERPLEARERRPPRAIGGQTNDLALGDVALNAHAELREPRRIRPFEHRTPNAHSSAAFRTPNVVNSDRDWALSLMSLAVWSCGSISISYWPSDVACDRTKATHLTAVVLITTSTLVLSCPPEPPWCVRDGACGMFDSSLVVFKISCTWVSVPGLGFSHLFGVGFAHGTVSFRVRRRGFHTSRPGFTLAT